MVMKVKLSPLAIRTTEETLRVPPAQGTTQGEESVQGFLGFVPGCHPEPFRAHWNLDRLDVWAIGLGSKVRCSLTMPAYMIEVLPRCRLNKVELCQWRVTEGTDKAYSPL